MSSDSTWYLKQVTTEVEEYSRILLGCSNIYEAFADPLIFLKKVREIISKQIKYNNLELLVQCIDLLYKAQSIMGSSRAFLISFVLEPIISCLSLAEIQDLAGTLLMELSLDKAVLSVLKLAIIFYLQLNAEDNSLVEFASLLFFDIFNSYPSMELDKLLQNYLSSSINPNSNNYSMSRRQSTMSQSTRCINDLYYIPVAFLDAWKMPKTDEEHALVLKAITNQYIYCKDIKYKLPNICIDLDAITILNQLLNDLISTSSIHIISNVLEFLEILLVDFPNYFLDYFKDLFNRLQELMGNTRSQTYLPAIHFAYSLAYHLPYTVTCPILFSRLSNPMDKASLLQVNMQLASLTLLSSITDLNLNEIKKFCNIAVKYLQFTDPSIISNSSKAQSRKEDNMLGNNLTIDSAADLLAVCLYCWQILKKSHSRHIVDNNSFPIDFAIIVDVVIHPDIVTEICERSFSLTLPSLLSHPYSASLLAQLDAGGKLNQSTTITTGNKRVSSFDYSPQSNIEYNNNSNMISTSTSNTPSTTSTEYRTNYSRTSEKSPPATTVFPPLKIITDFHSSTPLTEKINPVFDSSSTYQPSWSLQSGNNSGSNSAATTSSFPGSPWVVRDASKEVDRSKLSSIKKIGRPPYSSGNIFNNNNNNINNTPMVSKDNNDDYNSDQIIDEETVWSTSANSKYISSNNSSNDNGSGSYQTRNKLLPQTSIGLRSVPKDAMSSSLIYQELQSKGSNVGIGLEQNCNGTTTSSSNNNSVSSSVKAALAMGPQTPMEVGLYNSEGVRVQRLRRGGRLRASRAANISQLDGLSMPKESDSEQEGNSTSPIFDNVTRARIYTSDSASVGLGLPLLNLIPSSDSNVPLRYGKSIKKAFSIEATQNYDTSSFQNNTNNIDDNDVNTPSSQRLLATSQIRSGRRLVIGSDSNEVERPPERESVNQSLGTRLHYGTTMYSTSSASDRKRGMSTDMDENIEQEVDSDIDISHSVYESEEDVTSGTESIKSYKTGNGVGKIRKRRGGGRMPSLLTKSNEGQESEEEEDDNDVSNINSNGNTVSGRHPRGKGANIEHNVSSLQNQDAVIYLPSSEIFPSLNPSQELNKVLLELETSLWPEIFQTLTSVRRLGLHHQPILRSSGSLHAIVKGTLKQTENLRSAVCKNALLAVGDLFEGMKKDMDAEVTVATPVLVKRCADSSIFLSESAVQAIYQMIDGVSVSRSLTALLSCGDNRNAVVRSKVAEMLLKLVDNKGASLKGIKELQSLLVRLSKLISDPTAEARAASRDIVRQLLRHETVTRGELERHIASDMVDKCLREEITRSNVTEQPTLGRPPRGNPSSSIVSSSATQSSGKTRNRPPRREVSTKTYQSTEENLNFESPLHGSRNDLNDEAVVALVAGVDSVKLGLDAKPPVTLRSPSGDNSSILNPHNPSPKQRNANRNTATNNTSNGKSEAKKVQDSSTELLLLPTLLNSLLTSHWSERKLGVENMTEYIIENSLMLRKASKLESAMEALLSKVDDGSIKVSIQAVMCLQKLQERSPSIIPSMLPLAFPWLLCAASASNKEVCGLANILLWSVLEACATDTVLKQLSSTALHDRDRLKAVSLKLLGQFSVKRLSAQPVILKRDVFPTICRTLCTNTGVKPDVRAAAIEALRTLQSCTVEAIWKWTEIALQKDELKRILGS